MGAGRMKRMAMQALLTGLFCAGFALVVDAIAVMFGPAKVAGISFVSGFLGSLFAHTVMRAPVSGRGGRNG